MGLRLGEVPKQQRGVGGREAALGAGVHQAAVAAQQVRPGAPQNPWGWVSSGPLTVCSASRYLEYTLDPQKIRKQDATSTIVYIANNVVGQSLAWDFVRARWSYIFTQ